MYGQNGALMAQQIDPETGALRGSPVRVGSEVLQNPRTAWAAVDVSRNGVLAWRAPGVDEVQFEWVDRAGRTLQSISEVDSYTNFDLPRRHVHRHDATAQRGWRCPVPD